MRRLTMRLAATVALTVLTTGCGTTAAGDANLYRQLGGDAGVKAIANETVFRATRDRRIAEFFVGTDLQRLERLLAEQFCAVSGGPCEYSGASMEESHRGMGVGHAHFNALVEVLIDSMEYLEVPVPAQNGLLAELAPMYGDIVR